MTFGANSITMLMSVLIVSNDWNRHIASNFDRFELANTMMLLVISSVSCDGNTWHTTWLKKSCCTVFQSSWPNKQNGVAWCSHWCQQHHITKRVMSSCFILPLTKPWASQRPVQTLFNTDMIRHILTLYRVSYNCNTKQSWKKIIYISYNVLERHVITV